MKLLITSAGLALLLLSGCKKDMQKTLSQSLVGKWNVSQLNMQMSVFGKDTLVHIPQYAETLEFKSDFTCIDSAASIGARKGTWTLQDSTLVMSSVPGVTFTVVQLDDVQLKTSYTIAGSRTFTSYTRQ